MAHQHLPPPRRSRSRSTSNRVETRREVTVGACPVGCWLVFGEGFNTGWSSDLDGTSLGEPEQLAGGLNGWRLPASDAAQTIVLTWTPQPTVTVGLALSALGVLLAWGSSPAPAEPGSSHGPVRPSGARGSDPVEPRDGQRSWSGRSRRSLAALVVDVSAGVTVLLTAAVACGLLRRPRLLGVFAAAAIAVCGAVIARRVFLYDLPPGFDWLANVTDLHRTVLIVGRVAGRRGSLPREAGSTGGELPSHRSG